MVGTGVVASDTLVGIATGSPDGGVAIVRLSGPRARAIAEAQVGALPAPRVLGLRNLAGEATRRDEARALYEETLAIRERLVGAEHPKVAFPLLGLGDLAVDEGRLDEAERLYQRVLQIREKSLGPEHARLSFPLAGLARVALARDRPRDAAPLAERALRLRQKATSQARELAEDRFLAARAIVHEPDQAARARTLAIQAREGFAAAGAVKVKELSEVDAWLAKHAAP